MKITSKSTSVRSSRFGILRLRSLNLDDAMYIEELVGGENTARDFTGKLLHHQMESPDLTEECVASWPDKLLLRVASKWMQDNLNTYLPSTAKLSFEQFRDSVVGYLAEQMRQVGEAVAQVSRDILKSSVLPSLGNSLLALKSLRVSYEPQIQDMCDRLVSLAADVNSSIAKIFESIHRSFAEATTSALIPFGVIDVIPRLPDLSDFEERIEYAKSFFREAGWGFAFYAKTPREVCRLAENTPQIRCAVITNELLGHTRQKDFEADCANIFTSSRVLTQRWKIVQQALVAHRNRQYNISIPALLSQIEGILTDMMILNKVAIARQGKVFVRGTDGRPKIRRDGRPMELQGLRSKVNRSPLRKRPTLEAIVDILAESLIPQRNCILHGIDKSYGTAKLSTQVLLITRILAGEVHYFEHGRSGNRH